MGPRPATLGPTSSQQPFLPAAVLGRGRTLSMRRSTQTGGWLRWWPKKSLILRRGRAALRCRRHGLWAKAGESAGPQQTCRGMGLLRHFGRSEKTPRATDVANMARDTLVAEARGRFAEARGSKAFLAEARRRFAEEARKQNVYSIGPYCFVLHCNVAACRPPAANRLRRCRRPLRLGLGRVPENRCRNSAEAPRKLRGSALFSDGQGAMGPRPATLGPTSSQQPFLPAAVLGHGRTVSTRRSTRTGGWLRWWPKRSLLL